MRYNLPSVPLWLGFWLMVSLGPLRSATLQSTYSFSGGPTYAHAGLLQGRDGCLYGTSVNGGTHGGNYGGFGTVFKVNTNGTLSVLVSFDNIHGANPQAGLIQGSDGNLYGTTQNGGANNNINQWDGLGTVFKVTTNGVLTLLYSFTDGGIGGYPVSGVVQSSDGKFYGTRFNGGASGYGTVFSVTTNGVFTIMASFSNTNGANPSAELAQGNDGNFYGTTVNGGDYGYGTVFEVTTNGTLTTLASFTSTNGANPYGILVQGNDGSFYGTTVNGGNYGYGTVFQVTTNGTLTTLATFTLTNGANPYGGLVRGTDGSFYGTTYAGGAYSYQPLYINSWMNGYGTIFRLATNGTLTTIHSFGATTHGPGVPVDGGNPYGGLVQGTDGNLYGTTYNGGSGDVGTVFMVTTNGGFTTLVSLALNPQGANPYAAMVQAKDGNFYGTTVNGGANGYRNQVSGGLATFGTVFHLKGDGTFAALASFSLTNGANPYSGLVQSGDGTLYGTTLGGGAQAYFDGFGNLGNSYGTVFSISTNGLLTSLYSFTGGSDGARPYAGLVEGTDGNFYGTTSSGGSGGAGTVFMMTSNGALTTLASFVGTNGANPYSGLLQGDDGSFYGTTANGGTNGGGGTVFRVDTNGAVSMLMSFTKTFYPNTTIDLYPDGGIPEGGLIRGNDGKLYGTSVVGGTPTYLVSYGTVFQLTTNGAFTNLVPLGSTNGANPYAGLIQLSDGSLYGTTYQGGPGHFVTKPDICNCISYYGTLFEASTNGAFTDLVLFANSNGANPYGGLVEGSDGCLHGTTYKGGVNADNYDDGYGTVFRVILAPTIFSQPTNQTAIEGGNVTLAVGATGFAPISYQWRKNGSNIGGATNASLMLSSVTVASAANYSVAVSSPGGTVASSNATLTVVCPLITVAPATLPAAMAGRAYSQTNTATAGTGPYTFAITSGFLPPGTSLSTSGILSGAPTRSGTYTFTVKATDFYGCTGTNRYTLAVNCPAITLGSLLPATVGTAYNQTNTASGGAAPYTFAITGGNLPPGFALSTSGVLSGSATNAGSYNFTLRATDIYGCAGTNNYNFAANCPAITISPAVLPVPRIGTPYIVTNNASGGSAPYMFAVTGGSLPPGFVFSEDGVLSGTPANLGNYNFTVTTTDVYGCTGSQSDTLAIGILFVNPAVDSKGTFSAQVVGPTGSTFVVLASTNLLQPLSSWFGLSTNTAADGVFDFADTNSSTLTNRLLHRFYRVRLSP